VEVRFGLEAQTIAADDLSREMQVVRKKELMELIDL
jgi:hypothetical protein